MATTRLTIGMATHRDFDGVYFTVNAIRLYHADVLPRCELVIVDNDPDGPQAEQLRGFCAHVSARRPGWPQPFSVQYIPFREANGTAAPRHHIFQVAQSDAVLVLDSHVNVWPQAIAKLLEWYDAHPDSLDLLQGPLVYDDLATISTHFADVWRDGMWGTWDTDPRGINPDGAEFEIPAQGLGLFSCRKTAWLGFNPHFREFGGEEWYIHEKFRQAGRRCLCLPFLRWVHRFSAPAAGRAYRFTAMGKIRNYILGLQELGLPLDRLWRHYVEGLNEDPNDPINRDAHLTAEQFEELARDAIRYPIACGQDEGHASVEPQPLDGPSQNQGPALLLEDWYRRAVETPSDINEHCSTLRGLASQCEMVVEFGMRPAVSTVALLAGQPKRFITITAQQDPLFSELAACAERTGFKCLRGTSLDTEIPECDCLLIDTRHTEEQLWTELVRHAGQVRRWIALHDTEIFGHTGEDGGPGLLSALARFLRESSEWRPVFHNQRNHGLTVIARDSTGDFPLTSPDPVPPCLVMTPIDSERGDESPLGRDRAITSVRESVAPEPGGDSSPLPFVSCLCPTYYRPHLLSNALACFLAQDYPADRCELMILDDAGQFVSERGANWELISLSRRFRSLPDKFNALAGLARGDILVVWEDDDIYLPWHITAHVQTLQDACQVSKPSRVRSHVNGEWHEEPSAGRFHASLAMTRHALESIEGWPPTRRGDFDQQFLCRLTSCGSVGDPIAHFAPSYVFRWEVTNAYHGQGLMQGPDDESWYGRLAQPGDRSSPLRLEPQFDQNTLTCLATFPQRTSLTTTILP